MNTKHDSADMIRIVRRARLLLVQDSGFHPRCHVQRVCQNQTPTPEYADRATLRPGKRPLLPSDRTPAHKLKAAIFHSFSLPDRILLYERTRPHSPPTLHSRREIRIIIQPRHLFSQTIRFALFLDISISYRRSASIPTLILGREMHSRRQPRRFEFRGEKQEKNDLRDS